MDARGEVDGQALHGSSLVVIPRPRPRSRRRGGSVIKYEYTGACAGLINNVLPITKHDGGSAVGNAEVVVPDGADTLVQTK